MRMRINNLMTVVLLSISIILFVIGLSIPIISTKQQILGITLDFQNIWLFTSIRFFYDEGEFLLAFVILFFTFIFPVIKYANMLNEIFNVFVVNKKVGYILSLTDKWSMLDVFLVALLILNYKMNSSIIVMKIQLGTTFLAGSILLRMFVSILISKYKHDSISS